MADESETFNSLLEKIIGGINDIRSKRARPCFNTILSYLKRINLEVDMPELKSAVGDLITRGIIYDGGKDGESFYVNNMGEIDNPMDNDIVEENRSIDDTEVNADDVDNLVNVTKEDVELLNTTDFTLENLPTVDNISFHEHLMDKIKTEVELIVYSAMDDSFYNKIKGLIKDEVRDALDGKVVEFGISSDTKEAKECNDGNNNLLVKALNDNISFLQKELESKDVIIKMLVSERTLITSNKKDTMVNPRTISKPYDVFSGRVKDSGNVQESVNNINVVKECDEKRTNELNENKGFRTVKEKTKKNQRSIAIMGDSILKDVDPFELRKKLKNKADRVYRHSFNGATTSAMKHHSVPVMEFNPDLVILHCGTNSLRGPENEEKIATDILTLAKSLKTDTNDILVSSIVPRRDQLKEKAEKVNDVLCIKCTQFNVPFIKHNNLRSEMHLKPKGQHLNKEGSSLLSDNFAAWINN